MYYQIYVLGVDLMLINKKKMIKPHNKLGGTICTNCSSVIDYGRFTDHILCKTCQQTAVHLLQLSWDRLEVNNIENSEQEFMNEIDEFLKSILDHEE
jgi:hypothetical protein